MNSCLYFLARIIIGLEKLKVLRKIFRSDLA